MDRPKLYPGYDVLAKRRTQSWNRATRQVVDERLAITPQAGFFDPDEWRILIALCERITPQPNDRQPIPAAAMVDQKVAADARDGYRDARLPPLQTAWRRGLAALEAEAKAAHGKSFADLFAAEQDGLLKAMQAGRLRAPAWGDMPCELFFSGRALADVVAAYYAHPTAWSEIGFGGPAGPRGYVRMDPDERDPWEAIEMRPGHEARTQRRNRRVR
jgi:Gluconate 2-dehydrogenase subunit 3